MRKGVTVLVLIVATVGFVSLWLSGRQNDKGRNRVRQTSLQIETSLPSGFSPLIRVNVTPSSKQAIRIAVEGEYQILPVESPRVLDSGTRLESAAVSSTPTGIRIGKQVYSVSRLEIVPKHSPSVWVGNHQYRGRVRLFRRSGGSILVVNVLPLEDYLASVVDSEMPAKFPTDARQAQAVVARTYALYQMQVSAPHRFFDLHATTQSQKYLGYQYRDHKNRRLAGESPRGREIVNQTLGMVCTFRGRIFCTYYSAVCGGRTTAGLNVFSDAAFPLKSVVCQWCREARRYRWKADFTLSEVARRLREHFRSSGRAFGKLQTIRPTQGSSEFGNLTFDIGDGSHTYPISAEELRRILASSKVYSPRFQIRVSAERLIVEGRGHGHGVGLCQWGARGLALSGKNVLEIIQYYYPGSRVVVMQWER